MPSRPSSRIGPNQSRLIIALLIVGLLSTAAILGSAYAVYRLGGNSATSTGTSTCNNSQNVHFALVMDRDGYNYSASHNLPPPGSLPPAWPRMNVTIGSNVIIRVLNNDTIALTFLIGGFAPGVTLQPGASHVVTFCAAVLGTLTISNPEGYVVGDAQINVNP